MNTVESDLQKSPKISKSKVRGYASGVLFMGFFGMMWAGIGIGGLEGWGANWIGPLISVLGFSLMGCGILLYRKSKAFPQIQSEADISRKKHLKKGFRIIFGIEMGLIAMTSLICNMTDHFAYFFPVMALIVGGHFFPLAHLYKIRVHYIAGVLICTLTLGTLFFMPQNIDVNHHKILVWWSIIGFGTALILWGTGVVIAKGGFELNNKI